MNCVGNITQMSGDGAREIYDAIAKEVENDAQRDKPQIPTTPRYSHQLLPPPPQNYGDLFAITPAQIRERQRKLDEDLDNLFRVINEDKPSLVRPPKKREEKNDTPAPPRPQKPRIGKRNYLWTRQPVALQRDPLPPRSLQHIPLPELLQEFHARIAAPYSDLTAKSQYENAEPAEYWKAAYEKHCRLFKRCNTEYKIDIEANARGENARSFLNEVLKAKYKEGVDYIMLPPDHPDTIAQFGDSANQVVRYRVAYKCFVTHLLGDAYNNSPMHPVNVKRAKKNGEKNNRNVGRQPNTYIIPPVANGDGVEAKHDMTKRLPDEFDERYGEDFIRYLLEGTVSDSIAFRLGGKREVPVVYGNDNTIAGYIDVMTEDAIIEVKPYGPRLKHAIGQILFYGVYFPHHKKQIHTYFHGGERDYSLKNVCDFYGIELIYDHMMCMKQLSEIPKSMHHLICYET